LEKFCNGEETRWLVYLSTIKNREKQFASKTITQNNLGHLTERSWMSASTIMTKTVVAEAQGKTPFNP